MPVRLHYSASSLPRAWAWPRPQQGSVGDQGWCGGSSVVAALETAAARSVDTGLSTIIDIYYLCLRSIKRPQIQFYTCAFCSLLREFYFNGIKIDFSFKIE